MLNKSKNWKYSNLIDNKNYNFQRDIILNILSNQFIDKAFNTISSWDNYSQTPLLNLNKLEKRLGINKIFYKDESKRFNLKSFKALGGAYAVEEITKGDKKKIVSTATAGNHGRSVAWGAKRLGLKCKIFISEFVSNARAEEMKKLGADVIVVKGNYENSLNECKIQSKKNKWEIIQDVAWQDYELVPKLTMSGYSVMIKEISNQTSEYITHVIVQAGVGGMAAGVIAGIAKYFKRVPKIIVVEPENADCVLKSIENGELTKVDIKKESILGGMSCGEVSLVPWKILKHSVNHCVTISDNYISDTIKFLANAELSEKKIIGGECSTPGIISLIAMFNDINAFKNLQFNSESNVLLIGCEGDADEFLYQKLLNS
tara:strand:+ start:427 stop:1545 length:1119 start_codon:yes stop_codon:yes gene_type:complete